MDTDFPNFVRKAREIIEGGSELRETEDFRQLLCADCAFYHHGEEENEECGSFLLLRSLLERSAFDLERALDELE
jgi:hypothetical protein